MAAVSDPRRRLRQIGIVVVVLAAFGTVAGMVGVGGLLAVSFQRESAVPQTCSGANIFIGLLGLAVLAVGLAIPLFRAHRRLVEKLDWSEP